VINIVSRPLILLPLSACFFAAFASPLDLSQLTNQDAAERAIRQNPIAAGSAIVAKVLGALKN